MADKLTEAKHCLNCGDTHRGKCSTESFVYFKCQCGQTQIMPWDAMAFCGMKGIICGCGLEASKAWKDITSEEYFAEQAAIK